MGPKNFSRRCSVPIAIWCIWFATETGHVNAQAPPPSGISIVDFAGVVEVSPAGQAAWSPATKGQLLNPGDRVRTRQHSRLALRVSENDTLRFHDITEFQIQPPAAPKKKPGLNLLQGMLYLFHRGRPAEFDITTPTATAAIRGTEFNLEAQPGRTILTMIDGTVELSNEQGPITVNSREQGIAEPGKLPTKSPMLEITTVIQWCFYYPGVLDPGEVGLSGEEAQALTNSFAAYRDGDLQQALAAYPAGRQPASSAERVYVGALWLAAGQVEQTEALLSAVTPVANLPAGAMAPEKLADALREVIAAVKGTNWQRAATPQSATEWLAESYYEQSHSRLTNALKAARQAVEKSPDFGFGWERVAELEFSFGRISRASDALEKSLSLASRNAQAHSLNGFLLAARNKIAAAISSFDHAIALDGSLGNAWLGRGLCRIRKGDTVGGRDDLQMAAAVEPQRAVLRSYLAKAYGDEGDYPRANKEIQLAKELDERDPTAWLYSALLNQQQNRINEAVRDLEKSQELNDNRNVYRSRLLLDQDRAVRSANLAAIYRDAGMFDWSVQEASRAVSYDYANYSAHLFLANSYDFLRDPNRINLRYETPAESEYLIANLLAPVGAGTLSESISQQEYSKLFEHDRLGVVSATEYLSRGAWTEHGAQFGTFGDSSYAFEALYRSDPGQHPNNDFEERELRLHLKQQLTAQDSVYFRSILYKAESGDVIQYHDPAQPQILGGPNLGLRTQEKQEPIIHQGLSPRVEPWRPHAASGRSAE